MDSVCFSPDGKTLVGNHTGGWNHSVRLIDADTGAERLALPEAPGWMWAAAYAEDGKTLVTADREGTISEWDASTGRPIRARRVISRPPLPTRWWVLAGAVTAWGLAWGFAFPGRGAPEKKARPAWVWLTLVATVLLISGGLLHWVVLGEAGEGPDPIGFLMGMALVQLVAGLGLLGLAARMRPGWRPFAAGLLGGAIASV